MTGRITDPCKLTPKEKEVLTTAARLDNGSLNDIAAELNMKYNTINMHLKNCYSKLNVNNINDAIEHAISEKIISLDKDDLCPKCGTPLEAKVSGVECPNYLCNYRFCY